MTNKSSQKAGDNSSLLHVNTLTYGIDEKRVREIVDEKLILTLSDFSSEAANLAKERSAKFGKVLIDKMVKESALNAFAEPSFQILLLEAQRSAASTERENDYDLLAELLLHRFNKGTNRVIRAGVSRAVEIVDQISDEALLGLTAFHAVSKLIPVSGVLVEGLQALDDLFAKIISQELPTGTDWLDLLDILDAVRVSSSGGTKLLEDYWYEMFDGYVRNGLQKDSEAMSNAKKVLADCKMSDDVLKQNTAVDNYVKLSVLNKSAIDRLAIDLSTHSSDGSNNVPTSDEVKEALLRVYDLYDGSVMPKEDFVQLVDQNYNLKKLRQWWNTLQGQSIYITPVGRVLAHSNAQRLDNTLQPLD